MTTQFIWYKKLIHHLSKKLNNGRLTVGGMFRQLEEATTEELSLYHIFLGLFS